MTVVRRKFTSLDVIEVLSELFITQVLPKHIRSDNGSEFTSIAIRQWLNILVESPHLVYQVVLGRMGIMSHSIGNLEISC